MGAQDEKNLAATDISRLQANVKNLAEKSEELNETIKILQSKVNKGNVTNWSVITSMLGASLTGISMIGYLAIEPMKEEILRLRRFKMSAIKELVRLGEAGAVQKERTRALERSEFEEPKDQ